MRLPKLSRDREGKPRLKPGITFPRLIVFVVGMLAFVVVLKHFVEAPSPSYQVTECDRKGINSYDLKVGTCSTGSSTIAVVDKAEAVRLPTLEAKLLGFHETKGLDGLAGKAAPKGFLIVKLALTNRTEAPATVARGQCVLFTGSVHFEDAPAEKAHEPRSFLAREREIPPGGTEDGTVVFASAGKLAKWTRRGGNLDVVNLGSAVPAGEPEAIFSESEYGVIRTYH